MATVSEADLNSARAYFKDVSRFFPSMEDYVKCDNADEIIKALKYSALLFNTYVSDAELIIDRIKNPE